MALFPGALATFAGFVASHTLAVDNHAAQHNLEQAEIVAVQTKVGTGASTPVAGKYLKGTGAGTSAWGDFELTNTILDAIYPIGSVYINASDSTNPGTLLGFGTWVAWGVGKVIVGIDTGDTDFDTAEETGGAKTHTLTEAEMPSHTHIQDAHTHTQNSHTHPSGTNRGTSGSYGVVDSATASGSGSWSTGGTVAVNQNTTATNQNTGGGGAHNNLQPYQVGYVWKRTA